MPPPPADPIPAARTGSGTDPRADLAPLTARHQIVERFRRGLDRGHPPSLALHAAPGLGATTLAHHLGALARQSGVTVLDLTALPATAAMPFGSLAPLLPADLPITPDVDGLRGVREALLARADPVAGDDRALMVVVDDAHHLDELSAATLVSLTQDGVTLILTVRTGDHRPSGGALDLTALETTAGTDRIDLVPLSDDELARVVTGALGGPAAAAPVRTIQRLSNGAPAVAVAVCQAAVEDEVLVFDRGVWRQTGPLTIPSALVERSFQEIDAAGPGTRQLLELLTLAEPIDLADLRAVADPAALEHLDRQGLLSVEARGQRTLVRCARPVLTAAVAQHLGAATRALRARVLVDALDRPDRAAGTGDGDVDLALRAGLRLDAGDQLGRDEALTAARRALTVGRLDLAERLADAALAASPDDAEIGAFVAELLTLTGRNREAERLLARLRPRTPDEIALWAMTRAVALFHALEDVAGAGAVLRDARHQLADTSWQTELVGLEAVFELFLGRSQRAIDLTRPFVGSDNGREAVEAITAACPALTVRGRAQTAAELAQTGFERRVALGDQQMLSGPGIHLVSRAFALGELGALDEALDLCRFVYDEAAAIGSRDGVMWARLIEGRTLLTKGRYDDALGAFVESASCSAELDRACHQRWGRAGAVLALAQQGREVDTRAAEAALLASRPTASRLMDSEVTRALAWARVSAGHDQEARRLLMAAADAAADMGEHGMEILALHDLTRLGDVDATNRLIEVAAEAEGPLARARSDHAAGLAERDGDRLEAAADSFAALTAWVLAAEATAQAGTVARLGGHLQRADMLGRRAEELASHCRSARTPGLRRTDDLDQLTSREREVSTLAARGLRSKEIGTELGISVRTVDNLLQRSYRKLGVHNRAELRAMVRATS